MNTYKIPIEWKMFGTILINSNSLEEAMQQFDNLTIQERSNLIKNIEGEAIWGTIIRDNEEFVRFLNPII